MSRNSQIALLPCTAAVGLRDCQITKTYLAGLNALFVAFKNFNCLLLCASNVGLSPAARAAAIAMLHKQVAAANLAVAFARGIRASGGGVVLRHVDFKLLGIRFRRGLPARLLRRWVEVIWKVLRVRMANFPTGGKTCVGLVQSKSARQPLKDNLALPLFQIITRRSERSCVDNNVQINPNLAK